MDFLSHILIGIALSVLSGNPSNYSTITLFAVLPDLFLIPLYLYLGHDKKRKSWIPKKSDWSGFRESNKILSALWEAPHSLFFLAFIVAPIALYLHISWFAILSYLFHLLVYLATHRGEWAVNLFYPLQARINGITNAWSWPLKYMILSWAVILAVIMAISLL